MVQDELRQIFTKWGIPLHIKIDNGLPLGDPDRKVYTPLALWLIASGIKVILNRPRTPQDNAKVERNQGVLAKWVELKTCPSFDELRKRLGKETYFHNHDHHVKRYGNKTLLEVYPNMLQSPRPYDPDDFDPNRVLEFLKEGCWLRRCSSKGQFDFWGARVNLGSQYKGVDVSIKLDVAHNQWNVYDNKGKKVRAYDTLFTASDIKSLSCNARREITLSNL
jgi:hypothetical protein